MATKNRFEFNLINILIIYIFSVLYLQLIELFLPVRITKLVFVIALLMVFFGVRQKKIKFGLSFIFVCLVAAFYLVVFYLRLNSVFSYAYPPIFLGILLPLMARNRSFKPEKTLVNRVPILCLVYLTLNIFLWLIRYDDCFQVADRLQFKGALPHSNLYCSAILCIFFYCFYGRGAVGFLNRLFCILLIFATASRTYIVAIGLLLFVRILTAYGKKVKMSVKLCILFSAAIVFGPIVIALMIKFVPAMERFVRFGFTGNGRQVLTEAYTFAFKESSFFGKLFGFGMTERYLAYDVGEFAHSFTENSYFGILMLFGLVGLAYFGYYVVRAVLKLKNFQTFATLFVFLITFSVQDTLLSVQAGVMTVTAIYFMLINLRPYAQKQAVIEHKPVKVSTKSVKEAEIEYRS